MDLFLGAFLLLCEFNVRRSASISPFQPCGSAGSAESFELLFIKVAQNPGFLRLTNLEIHADRLVAFLLTLGAHAQRGLQYLVCVSVCLLLNISLFT